MPVLNTFYFTGLLFFYKIRFLEMNIQKHFMAYFFVMVCTNSITKSASFISLDTSYFSSNIFIYFMYVHFFLHSVD